MIKKNSFLMSLTLICVLAVNIIFFTACGKKDETPKTPEDQVIKIGAILPLTGNLALYGVNEQRGMELAAEEVNSQNEIIGKKLRILFEDSKGQTKDGLLCAQRLISIEKVKILFTSLTGVSLTVKTLSIKNGILQFVFAMGESITVDSDNVFRIYPGLKEEANSIVEYVKNLKPQRISILHIKHEGVEKQVNEFFLPTFRTLGINSIEVEPFDMNDLSSLRFLASKIKRYNPDLILIKAYYNQISTIFKFLKENNIGNEYKKIGGLDIAVALNNKLIEPELLEGVIVATPTFNIIRDDHASASEKVRSFIERYYKKFNEMPNYDSVFGYDSIKILSFLLNKKSKLDIESLKKDIIKLSNYNGLSGKITFYPDGNVKTEWNIAIINKGKMETFNHEAEGTNGRNKTLPQ